LELTSGKLHKTAEQDFRYFQFGLLDQNAVATHFRSALLGGSASWCFSLPQTMASRIP
jgi:hypothetical protein